MDHGTNMHMLNSICSIGIKQLDADNKILILDSSQKVPLDKYKSLIQNTSLVIGA